MSFLQRHQAEVLALLAVAAGLALPATPVAAQTLAGPPSTSQGAGTGPATTRLTSTVNEVDVPVLVLDKQGQPIEGLEADDFKLLDDNLRQKIVNFDASARPVSLAIVVDISDDYAVLQANRSAQTIAQMVIGATGTACLYVGGPEPKEVVPFTSDSNRIADALAHLKWSGPSTPLTEPINAAMLQVEKQPRDHTRAVLVITRSLPRVGQAAETVMEATMTDAVPIFRLSPNRPKNADTSNPVSTQNGGTGPGSQTGPPMEPPIDAHGQPEPVPGSDANVNLGPILSGTKNRVTSILRPHYDDYVYDSGGETFSASSDNDFDQKLNEIGNDLRSIYHLYFKPNDLSAAPEHVLNVSVYERTDVGKLFYRRDYLGYQPH